MNQMKKKLIKVIIFTISISMIFLFTGCGNPENDAKDAVTTTLDALKDGDLDTTAKLFVGDKDLQAIIDENSGQDTVFDDEQLGKFFANLTYEIKDAKVVDDSTVNVNVKVSNVNMSTVLSAWYVDIVSIALENYGADDETLSKLFYDSFSKEIDKTVENKDLTDETVTIEVVKKDDTWVLNPTEDLIDKLTGGLISAFNNVEGDIE